MKWNFDIGSIGCGSLINTLAKERAMPKKWWRGHRMVRLQFKSKKEFGKATQIVCGEERGMPYNIVGNEILVVPKDALSCFDGLKYKIVKRKNPKGKER